MKNPPLWRIVRVSRFSIVRLWHGPLSRSRDIYSRYYERVCFRAGNKESLAFRFSVSILSAILRCDILQYYDVVVLLRGRVFESSTIKSSILSFSFFRNRGVRSFINILKLPTDCVCSQRVGTRWILRCARQPFNGFFRSTEYIV